MFQLIRVCLQKQDLIIWESETISNWITYQSSSSSSSWSSIKQLSQSNKDFFSFSKMFGFNDFVQRRVRLWRDLRGTFEVAPTLSKKEDFAASPMFSLKVDFAVVYLPSICLFVSLLRVCVPFLCYPEWIVLCCVCEPHNKSAAQLMEPVSYITWVRYIISLRAHHANIVSSITPVFT